MITLGYDHVFAGRYRVVRSIAAGGMGSVYEVVHTETERHLALKVLLPSLVDRPEIRDRFKKEAKITATVESDAIVQVFDAGVDAETGMPFLVMELLKGGDLSTLLKRRPLGATDVIKYLHQVAVALDKTHKAGVVHRDLKPENLYLARKEDGSLQIKILDFGVAKLVVEGTANSGATSSFGTPLYMAPEQFMCASVSPATDIYSLGMIAFTLLVGEPYWEAEAAERTTVFAFANLAIRGTTEAATARALKRSVKLPEEFDPWFSKMTAVEPANRYASATAAIADLSVVLDVPVPVAAAGGDSAIEPPSAPAPSHTTLSGVLPTSPVVAVAPPSANRRLWAALGVALLLLVGGFALRRNLGSSPEITSPTAPEAAAAPSLAQPPASAPAVASEAPIPSASSLTPAAAAAVEPAPDASSTARRAPMPHTSASATEPLEIVAPPEASRRSLYSRE
ncbi:MAG: protein kinase [Deltaproteobacteria bacterium]|nr:protein kinase [Deltaproteobacteria bacterium]